MEDTYKINSVITYYWLDWITVLLLEYLLQNYFL